MGGAERNARKRRQQRTAVRRASAASGGRSSRTTIVAVAGVIVLAAVVIGGAIWINAAKNETAGEPIPVASEPGKLAYPATRENVVVVRGSEEAQVTIDIYEDFLCPYCGQFEHKYGEKIEEKIAAGKLRVRYHLVPLLIEASDPPGYSLDAANAALCAADAGIFVPFHDSLFANQPAEGTRGYSKEQMIQLGRKLGAKGEQFAQCVRSGKYNEELKAALQDAINNPELQRGGSFGTPTVVADGKILKVFKNENWLSDLLSGNEA